MSGGADTGFRHVTPEEYKPRLLHFCGTSKNIVVFEVPLSRAQLTPNDVFILDLGVQIFQWNGSACCKDEKFKAMQYLTQLKGERGSAQSETLDEDDTPAGVCDDIRLLKLTSNFPTFYPSLLSLTADILYSIRSTIHSPSKKRKNLTR